MSVSMCLEHVVVKNNYVAPGKKKKRRMGISGPGGDLVSHLVMRVYIRSRLRDQAAFRI
jgi:hypothetical protein